MQHTHEWAEFSFLLDMAKTYFKTDLLEPEKIILFYAKDQVTINMQM
jgi:hypothetical protein